MPPPPSIADSGHPLQIAARTYALSLSLALTPALVPLVTSPKARIGGLKTVLSILRRELGWNGFALAMTVGVGGGSALQYLLEQIHHIPTGLRSSERKTQRPVLQPSKRAAPYISTFSESYKAFIANALSAALTVAMLQSQQGRSKHRTAALPMTVPLQDSTNSGRVSRTLELTLLLFVRAMDAIVRTTMLPPVSAEGHDEKETRDADLRRRRSWTTRLDALVFWASSARIMWCFFYEPARLPRSYNKWIMSLANIDHRILGALRAIRAGTISYTNGRANPANLVSSFAEDLGYPAAWGDFSRIPAHGGPTAANAWRTLNVPNRDGLGGIPCELVHGGVGGASCAANAAIRGTYAFLEAIAIYLPVHALPILLVNPRKLLRVSELTKTSLAIFQSSAFLSTFVSSIWISVCLTRTLLLARLIPGVTHDFWDGPLGCTWAGSLVCGASIWIEQGRRRGEMSLYVLPRALRACLSESWIRSGSRSVKLIERLAFILSLATLLTASTHRSDSLRGLSRWSLNFIMKGPTILSWKRKKQVSKRSSDDDVTPS